MTTRRELGTITRSEGAITCLEFFSSSHLFCGTERGDVLVWKAHHWEQLPSLKGHTGRVNAVSVHPSGVLALTVSQDKTLKLWDLAKGSVAHTNKLEQEADHVKWSPDGEHYIVVSDKRIVLYSSHGKKLRTLSESKRIIAVTWINNTRFATGGEDRKLFIWDIHSEEPVMTLTGFQNRIKGVAIMPKIEETSNAKEAKKEKEMPLLVTISSDERLRIWDPNQSSDTPVCSIYQDVRFICITVAPVPTGSSSSEKKAKNKERLSSSSSSSTSHIEDIAEGVSSSKPSSSSNKRFKVFEFEEHQPIRKPSSTTYSATPSIATSSKPLKSILKKRDVPQPSEAEDGGDMEDLVDAPSSAHSRPSTSASSSSHKSSSRHHSSTRFSAHPEEMSGRLVVKKFSGKRSLASLFQ